MKKLVFVLIMSLAMFALTSCKETSAPNPVKVITADVVSNVLSTTIISQLSCSGEAAVRADVGAQVSSWFGVQRSAEKGIISDMCKMAVKSVLPTLIGTGASLVLKPTWECKLTNLNNAVDVLGTAACGMINQ